MFDYLREQLPEAMSLLTDAVYDLPRRTPPVKNREALWTPTGMGIISVLRAST